MPNATSVPTESIEAYVLNDRHMNLRKETLYLDPPKPSEVSVEVAACGVCHTDLHVMKDEVAFPRPAVLGHEITGVVKTVGKDVNDLKPGDRVVCSFIMPCKECRHCARGLPEICERFFQKNRLNGQMLDGTTRIHGRNGAPKAMYSMSGHATQAIVPASAVYKLPDSVSLQDAAILGCSLFTAYGAVHQVAGVRPGETVAVIAAGGIGLSIIHLAKAAGALEVIAIDIDDEKLSLARQLGATKTINSNSLEPIEEMQEYLGHGLDVVFEALGSTPTTRLATDLVDDGGKVVLAGIAPAGQTLDVEITKLVRRKIQILGSFGANPLTVMPKVIALAESGEIDLAKLITHRFAFHEVEEAYSRLAQGRIRGRAVVEIGTLS